MATETAAVAAAQTGETQNTEVALTATPDTEAYNTVIEMLKSRELELSVTQLGLLVAQKTGYESTDDVWIGVLSPNSVFPGLSTAHYAYSVSGRQR